ncbi:hypothetical protein BSCH_00254 [Candidatus Paraburkholderia schumanniana]|nr:hypothetical protein BSCH_00254 [Candidatus Paraburkholderia schumannianae]
MQSFFCYADEVSISALESIDEKVVLLGSDFGYGNFGDIAQMMNTISFHQEMGRYRRIIVMTVDAMGDSGFPEFARQAYKADGVLFVSPAPLDLADSGVGLQPVRTIRNVGAVHLYGGGFLNDKWGDFVLGVTEHLVQLLQPSVYVASGEQVTAPYEKRVVDHIRTYRPSLFGVRDEQSRKWMTEAGFEPSFSFDDATEALHTLTARLPLRRGRGLFVHLNVSGYTANAPDRSGIPRELRTLQSRVGRDSPITLLQAYSDRRLEVFDARESIKELERASPFNDYRTLELAQLAYQGWPALSEPVVGDIAYSCSYHVALWLQLAGIPCWLRGSNLFYQQKRSALQVDQDFDAFMREPKLADHSTNLERRGAWLDRLRSVMKDAPSFQRSVDLALPEGQTSQWRFKGNRMRQWQEQAQWSHQQIAALSSRVAELESFSQSERQRADALDGELQNAQQALQDERARSELEKARVDELSAEAERSRGQILALTAKVTDLGSRVRTERRQLDEARDEILRYYAQTCALTSSLEAEQRRVEILARQVAGVEELAQRTDRAQAFSDQIIRSRTWRWTKPLRFGARVLRGDWSAAWSGLRRLSRHS